MTNKNNKKNYNKNSLLSNSDAMGFEGEESLELSYHPHQMSMDTEIRIAKEQSSVFELLRRENRGDLILSPDFQRRDVWSAKQQSELIESILMGIPIPLIYLFENENGIRQIIDGKQRISALKKYINNEFSLSQLSMYPELTGKKFSDIPELLKSKLEDYQIHSYVIQPPTPEYVKFNIFERVNRGGVNLNKQEMRHALYQGKATELIQELAESNEFKCSTGNGVKSERMKDCYLILRFISFYLLKKGYLPNFEYRSDIDSFLASVMKFLNENGEVINHVKKACLIGMNNTYIILGSDGFRFEPKSGKKRRPINMGLFEILVFIFSQLDIVDSKVDISKFKKYIINYKKHFDQQDILSGTIDTTDNVNIRFDLAFKVIKGINDDYLY